MASSLESAEELIKGANVVEMQLERTVRYLLKAAKLGIRKGMKDKPFMHVTMKFKFQRWLAHSKVSIYICTMKVQEVLSIAQGMT